MLFRSLADADPSEAVGALVAIIREMRPHVVVTYDPNGGYGHPDHIQAHRVTTAAVEAAAASEGGGEPWDVPKFYWTVTPRGALADGLRRLADVDLPSYRSLLWRLLALTAASLVLTAAGRSEERRVGKECRPLCRSRWSPYH